MVLRSFSQLGASGGTVASVLGTMRTASGDAQARSMINDPYTFTTDRDAEPELGAQPDFPWRRGRGVAPELAGFWIGGFVMGPYNSRIVRRSNALQDWSYGRQFRYLEAMSLGKSFAAPVASALVTGALAAAIGLGNRYASGDCPDDWWSASRPSRAPVQAMPLESAVTTPSRRTPPPRPALATWRLSGRIATPTKGRRCCSVKAVWRWRWTVIGFPGCGGVLTPAAAMGDALLARLPAAGVCMGTTRLTP